MSKNKIVNGKFRAEISEIVDNSYIGEVVSLEGTPEHPGRVKIKVYGIFDSVDLGTIPVESLPYSYPYYSLSFGSAEGTGSFSAPKVGSKLRVLFENDIYHSKYISSETLSKEVLEEIKKDPVNFHSLIFDTDEKFKVYYTQKTGYIMDLDRSVINIRADKSIFINHQGSSATIELKGPDIDIVSNNSTNISSPNNITLNSQLVHANGSEVKIGTRPIFSNVNGEILMSTLKALAKIIDKKLPISPESTALIESMEPLILSTTVTTTP